MSKRIISCVLRLVAIQRTGGVAHLDGRPVGFDPSEKPVGDRFIVREIALVARRERFLQVLIGALGGFDECGGIHDSVRRNGSNGVARDIGGLGTAYGPQGSLNRSSELAGRVQEKLREAAV